MILLTVLAVTAASAGALTMLALSRWPRMHAGAPRLTTAAIRDEVVQRRGLAALLRRRLDPATVSGLLLIAALTLIAVAGAATGILLAMIRSEAGIARSDGPVSTWAAEHSSPQATDVLRWISLLGGTSGTVIAGLAAAAIALRHSRNWAVVTFLAIGIGGQFALVNIIKSLVDRARPDIAPLTGFAGASFPSGHAAAAACTFACAALVIGRGRSRRAVILLSAAAVAVGTAVACTRVLLGVHWLTDVIAGLLIGWAWMALCSIAFGGRLLHFGEPVAVAETIATGSGRAKHDVGHPRSATP